VISDGIIHGSLFKARKSILKIDFFPVKSGWSINIVSMFPGANILYILGILPIAMKRLLFCFITIVLISCERKSEADLPVKVIESIKARVENGSNPSIVVGIVDKDGQRFYSFGKTSLTGAAVNEHTIYEIGSISKVFTAILLAEQAKAGKLRIDDPAQKFLPPDIRLPKGATKEITLGNLSDHTSGLPRMPSNFAPRDYANPYADYTVDQMFEFISAYRLPRDVGAEYEYSNLAQGLLGHILALNADTSYEALMISAIAEPLGMKETKVILDPIMKANLAIGHSEGEEVSNWDIPTLAGAGGIRSSVHDMLKFLAANMGLTATSLKIAMDQTHQVRHFKAGSARVGLGWHVIKGKLGDIVCHSGGTGGYRTFAGFVKETKKGVVVFTNSTAGVDDIGYRLLDPNAVITPFKPTPTVAFKNIVETVGVDSAIAFYEKLKKERPDDYDFSKGVLNTIGYEYLNKDLSSSVAILKLNTEEHPEWYNSYESYAEALLRSGNKNLAVENYKKSLKADPSNNNAIVALEKLGISWQPPVVDVPEHKLETYTGNYRFFKGLDISITRVGTELFAEATGSPQSKLYPKSTTEFYTKVVRATLIFDPNGETLILRQSGQELKGSKVTADQD
jgi:serine-type D-Ala-D-Ala carboxypeptidase/endopeptidase